MTAHIGTGNSHVRTASGNSAPPRKAQIFAASCGLLGALAASSCCVLPVFLFSLGIGGAWIGNFTQLAPYKPYFVAVTAAFLAIGYWLVYRRPAIACDEREACARPLPNRLVKTALVIATLLVIIAFGFDYVAPYLLT